VRSAGALSASLIDSPSPATKAPQRTPGRVTAGPVRRDDAMRDQCAFGDDARLPLVAQHVEEGESLLCVLASDLVSDQELARFKQYFVKVRSSTEPYISY
jgi:hypothetical protein